MNAAGEVIDHDDDAYNYEDDIQRMHVLFEVYLFYEQVLSSVEHTLTLPHAASHHHPSSLHVILQTVAPSHVPSDLPANLHAFLQTFTPC